jgi:hypothetical protein
LHLNNWHKDMHRSLVFLGYFVPCDENRMPVESAQSCKNFWRFFDFSLPCFWQAFKLTRTPCILQGSRKFNDRNLSEIEFARRPSCQKVQSLRTFFFDGTTFPLSRSSQFNSDLDFNRDHTTCKCPRDHTNCKCPETLRLLSSSLTKEFICVHTMLTIVRNFYEPRCV